METIDKLKERIHLELKGLIAGKYCLLDCPWYSNPGDHLIWLGEELYLHENVSHKCVYLSSIFDFSEKCIPPASTIVFRGGGNLGDLYSRHDRFRLKIIHEFKDHPIRIFPQTVFYQEKSNFIRLIETLESHPDLILCVRDKRSYSLIKEASRKIKVLLVPDMSFQLTDFFSPRNSKSCILYLLRRDKESKITLDFKKLPRGKVCDWPRMGLPPILRKGISLFTITQLFFMKKNYPATKTVLLNLREKVIKNALSLYHSKSIIISDRLHAHILALLLGKKCILLDNSYGKNREFYNTWLQDIKTSCFAENCYELSAILKKILCSI